MPRQRFIWPDLWSDPGFATLEPIGQVLYIGCFSNADDDGRLHGDAAYLKSTVFPRARHSIPKVLKTRDCMLRAMPKLRLYIVERVEYLVFVNWSEWQHPKYPKPSRLPEPFPESLEEAIPQIWGNVSGNDSSVGWVGLGRDEKPLAVNRSLDVAAQHGDFKTPNLRGAA